MKVADFVEVSCAENHTILDGKLSTTYDINSYNTLLADYGDREIWLIVPRRDNSFSILVQSK